MSDHYQVLGVERDATNEIIVSAYRALIKAFHPDIFKGDKRYAEERLKSINAAFYVIGDPERRKKYDYELGEDNVEDDSRQEDWKRVCDFFPFLCGMEEELSCISKELGQSFKTHVLEKKAFNEAEEIRNRLLDEFARNRFGSEERLQKVGLAALRMGHRRFAAAINQARRLIGGGNSGIILERLSKEYPDEAASVYSACGFQHHFSRSSSHQFRPGLYRIGNRLRFRILPDGSVNLYSVDGIDLQDYRHFQSLKSFLSTFGEHEENIYDAYGGKW